MTSDPLMKGKSKAYIKAWQCSRANEQVIKAYIIILATKRKHTSLIMRIKSMNPLVVCGVIRDVLDPFTNSVSLRVVYDNNKEVSSGELKPSQIVNPPRVQVGGNDLRTLYTLFGLHIL
jgi:spore coat polysaccharide biosynthesis protein SpsF (cytidylyltransferase family)